MKFKNMDSMLFETGNATTDGSGTVTVTLNCFRPDETPCLTAVSYDVDGNSNISSMNLSLVGGVWQADIVSSSPHTKVYYHAFRSTLYVPLTNLITQDLFDLVTQNDDNLVTQ